MKTCTKCGESGESRKGHRQCHACELAYPDPQLAKIVGLDYKYVAEIRNRHGIPSYTAKCKEAA
jgi:hypothetical protein